MAQRQNISLHSRIRLTRLEYAFTRFESAATIALTIVAIPLTQILATIAPISKQAWLWIAVAGVGAEVVLIVASMSDANAGKNQVRAMLEKHYGVVGIQNEKLQALVHRAIDHRTGIDNVLGGRPKAARQTLSETVAGVDSWIRSIGRLAKRLDRFLGEAAAQVEEKLQLLERTAELDQRARATADERLRRQLRETIAVNKHRHRMICELESVMERGELRLEQALTSLGTIHTQATLFAARGLDEYDATRLAGEISAEIEQVDGVLAAMDRVLKPEEFSGAEEYRQSLARPDQR